MIITCEYCQTKFKVPDKAIGPHGRAVRCSDCNHQWIEKGLGNSIHNTNLTPGQNAIDERENYTRNIYNKKKSIYETKAVRYFVYCLTSLSFLLLLTVIIFSNPESFPKPLQPYLSTFEYSESAAHFKIEALQHDMQIVKLNDNYHLNLNLKIGIRNTANHISNLEAFKLTAFNAQKEKIDEYIIKLDKTYEANEIKIIEESFEKLSPQTTFITFEVGNVYSLYFHNYN